MTPKTLSFEIVAEDARWKTGRFEIENLKVVTEDGSKTLAHDRIRTYLDGALERHRVIVEKWSCRNMDDEDLFTSILNAYLRNDIDNFHFGDEWDVFKELKLSEGEGPAEKIIQYVAGDFEEYELILAVPEKRYYVFEDVCMLCDEKGGILTDIEVFFKNEWYADIVKILKNETSCLYKGYDFDCTVEEYGGPEGFLKTFDDKNN